MLMKCLKWVELLNMAEELGGIERKSWQLSALPSLQFTSLLFGPRQTVQTKETMMKWGKRRTLGKGNNISSREGKKQTQRRLEWGKASEEWMDWRREGGIQGEERGHHIITTPPTAPNMGKKESEGTRPFSHSLLIISENWPGWARKPPP
jgi:hypothetical protein